VSFIKLVGLDLLIIKFVSSTNKIHLHLLLLSLELAIFVISLI